MELTFANDFGHTFTVEIDPNMELENVMALLEAESGIPVAEQSISFQGQELNQPNLTMRALGVGDKAVLLLRKKMNIAGQTVQQDAEMIRLQILGNPQLMRRLEEAQPDLADAARTNSPRFAEILRQTRERQHEAEIAQMREIERLNANPYDIEAQQKIEEAIRQQAVMENMEHAIEYSPESFGRVTMLYIPVEVNSKPVKAFVDSGAQQTIMTPGCAEACGIMRLVDQRYSGIARGVGTAKILGRVHSAQLKLSDLHLPCAITIMEGQDVDLLLGLDMLKAHQACIDLEKGVLRIQGREVAFLSEHELPEKARNDVLGEAPPDSLAPVPSSSSGPSRPASSFPGGGNVLGAQPSAQPVGRQTATSQPDQEREGKIRMLMDLGANREDALRTLEAAGWNVDYAASLLF